MAVSIEQRNRSVFDHCLVGEIITFIKYDDLSKVSGTVLEALEDDEGTRVQTIVRSDTDFMFVFNNLSTELFMFVRH